MKVAVVSEFYPRRADPVLGVWAHRQMLATARAGAEVQVLVLNRLVPPQASFASGLAPAVRAFTSMIGQPLHEDRDGLPVTYVPFVSPPRWRSYHRWGAWAAPPLALALRALRAGFPFELIHVHNAVPGADAVRRIHPGVPLVVSVHGGDVLHTVRRGPDAQRAVHRSLAAADLVLANSQGIADLARAHGARECTVVHLGADSLAGSARRDSRPTLITIGHLIERKRHADVIRALAVLRRRHPELRYVIIGDGPERVALTGLAARLGVADAVELRGQLDPESTLREAQRASIFVMPSLDEAFGVAYIEAMAAGLPAIGCRGEPGPEEIAAVGDGMLLVPPGDIERLTQRIDELIVSPTRLREAGRRARETVATSFTWARCGEQTVSAYERVLRSGAGGAGGSAAAP